MLARALAVAVGLAASAAAFGSGVTLTPILVQGLQAPGKAAGVTIGAVTSAWIGDGGHVVTDTVLLQGPGIPAGYYGISYTGLPGTLSAYVESGLPAGPLGPDLQFPILSSVSMSSRPNAAGDFVFSTTVSGTSVDATNDAVTFARQGGDLSLLFRESSFHPSFPNGEFINGNGDLLRGARLLDNGNLVTRVQMKGGPGGLALQDNLLAGPVGAPAVVLAWGAPPPGCAENLLWFDFANLPNRVSPAGKFIVSGALAGAPTTSDNALWTGDANTGSVSLWLREGGSLPGLDPANVTVIGNGEVSINDAGEALAALGLQTGVGDSVNENDQIVVYGTPGNLSVLVREDDQVPGLPAGVRYGHYSWCGVYNGGVLIGKSLVGNVPAPNADAVILAGPPGSLSVKMRTGDPAPSFPAGHTLGAFDFGNPSSLKLHASGRFAVEVTVLSDTGTSVKAIYMCAPDSAPQLVCAWDQVLEVAPCDLRKVKQSGSGLSLGSGNINALGQVTFAAGFTDGTSASMIASVSPVTGPSFAAAGELTVSDASGNADGTPDPAESMIGLTIPVRNAGVVGATGITATLTSCTPTVTVQTANAAYPDLASGGAGASNATPFVISVSPAHPCGGSINLKLEVTSAEGTNVVFVTIPSGSNYPGCAVFALAPPTVVSDTTGNGNGNGFADPGESAIALTIPVRKSGGAGTSAGVSATLTTTTPTASIVSGTAAYPDIGAGTTQSNSTPFVIALDPSHPCGAPINLHLSLTADGGLGMGEMDLVLNSGSPAVPTTFSRININASIPDNDINGVAVDFTVSGFNGTISDLNFRFDGNATISTTTSTNTGIGHASVGQLVISLTSPDPDGAGPLTGTTVVLADHLGPNSIANNLCVCTLDDAAASSIQTVGNFTGPVTGTFQPFEPLSAFNGLGGAAVNGTWVLKVADTVPSTGGIDGGQGGKVNRARIILTNAPVCQSPGTASEFCCRGTTCNAIAAGSCTGTVAGSASIVVGSCGTGGSIATCCFADFNHDGTPSIDDLFLYLNAYFSGSPWANVGGDGVVSPTIDDLFLYINAYFTGCS